MCNVCMSISVALTSSREQQSNKKRNEKPRRLLSINHFVWWSARMQIVFNSRQFVKTLWRYFCQHQPEFERTFQSRLHSFSSLQRFSCSRVHLMENEFPRLKKHKPVNCCTRGNPQVNFGENEKIQDKGWIDTQKSNGQAQKKKERKRNTTLVVGRKIIWNLFHSRCQAIIDESSLILTVPFFWSSDVVRNRRESEFQTGW